MRIAIDASVMDSNWGGIPKYLDRIARGLVEAGDRVDLLANTRALTHPVPGTREVGVRIKGLVVWREAFLPAWLAWTRPDVMWAPGMRLPRLLPVPSVLTLYDLAPLLMPGIKPATETHEFATAVRRSAERATRVIAISQTTARDATRLWRLTRAAMRMVPIGIDDAYVPGDRAAARAAVRKRWGLHQPFVLAVGSLEPRKGLDVLIEAAERAVAAGRPWRLVLAGRPGFQGERIAERARAGRACTVLGGVEEAELIDLYRAAELLAAPSLYEGFGLTPLEAMACGTPAVVASDGGGLEEFSGPAAELVRERTPEAWLDGIDRALAARERLAAAGRAHAARFRWETTVAATREVLAEAAATG